LLLLLLPAAASFLFFYFPSFFCLRRGHRRPFTFGERGRRKKKSSKKNHDVTAGSNRGRDASDARDAPDAASPIPKRGGRYCAHDCQPDARDASPEATKMPEILIRQRHSHGFHGIDEQMP